MLPDAPTLMLPLPATVRGPNEATEVFWFKLAGPRVTGPPFMVAEFKFRVPAFNAMTPVPNALALPAFSVPPLRFTAPE